MRATNSDIELSITLLPSLPHFGRYINDDRLSDIRLNNVALRLNELRSSFEKIETLGGKTRPLWFDFKGRQPRVVRAWFVGNTPEESHLEVLLNHPVRVPTPAVTLFKAESDSAVLARLEDGGRKLVFTNGKEDGPYNEVRTGESIHVRHPEFRVRGRVYVTTERRKIALSREFGYDKFYLSFVEKASDDSGFCRVVARADLANAAKGVVPNTFSSMYDLDEAIERVGRDVELRLKIETPAGLHFVANEWKPRKNVHLVAACGDMYVELERADHIFAALKLIIEKDPGAQLASRIFLSMADSPVPSRADFLELAWLYDIGYRKFMMCDHVCVKEELLEPAINAFQAFREEYVLRKARRTF